MPVTWQDNSEKAPEQSGAFFHAKGDPPTLVITLWPHRSLPRPWFAAFILITYLMFLMPLMALLGTKVLWGLLPFLLGTIALVWYFFERNYRDAHMSEVLSLWNDRAELVRTEVDGTVRDWHANPYWIEVKIQSEGGPVPHYLTLRGSDRIVEFGAFLSPEERQALYSDLVNALNSLR